LRLIKREWFTDIGPVDLMCRDADESWVAVEIKRVAGIEAVEQLTRYLERIRLDPAFGSCRGVLAAQVIKPQARVVAGARGTGAGKGFCAGMDLKAFVAGERPWAGDRGFAGITQRAADKPLIAAIEGFAVAGGLEVALSCDLIVAAKGARLGIPEVKRSLVAA